MTEAIARMDDADSIPKARLLYFSTPFMSPRSSSILTEDGAELPSRSKKKKSGAVRFCHRNAVAEPMPVWLRGSGGFFCEHVRFRRIFFCEHVRFRQTKPAAP